MAQVTVRNLDEKVVEALKERAARRNRSLEAELRLILEMAATERTLDVSDYRARADAIRAKLRGRPHSDSVDLLREDRQR